MSEISIPKSINMICTDDHERFLIFMLHYYLFDIDFNYYEQFYT